MSQPLIDRLHNPRAVMAFGILQVIFGCVMVLMDIIAFSTSGVMGIAYSAGASGFWSSIFHLIGGSFGIVAGQAIRAPATANDKKCALITSMVMAILSTLWTFSLVIAFAILLPTVGFASVYDYHYYYYDYDTGYNIMAANLTFNVLLFIVSLGQSISAGINLCNLPSRAHVMVVTTTGGVPAPVVGYGYPQHQGYMQPNGTVAYPQYGNYGQPVFVQQQPPAYAQQPQQYPYPGHPAQNPGFGEFSQLPAQPGPAGAEGVQKV